MRDGLICAFVYYGGAVAKVRPRVTMAGGFARAYTPNKTGAFESKLRAIAAVEMAKAGQHATPDACRVEIAIERAPNKSWSKKKAVDMRGQPVTTHCDLDNQIKAICDALNGVVWEDDVQVSDVHASRRWGEQDCVRVAVYRASGEGVLAEVA
ncbi:MAG: RusA family crossover junction endodeoxyribonuclease [Brevundimonas sp.]|nr:RusA family crossover junction endodeoxyribonuclease [Brevundimonas sp.]